MKIKLIILLLVLIGAYFLFTEVDTGFYINKEEFYTDTIYEDESSVNIASFNIQTFGKTKSGKEDVMEILVDIACEFDIIAVQEIRDISGFTGINYFNLVNESCGSRNFILSEPLGRSSSKETYLIIYDEAKVKLNPLVRKVYDDKNDYFEREPLYAQFKIGKTSFILVNNHIKPDAAKEEIKALNEVILELEKVDKDIIILGDFNADCSYFNEYNRRVLEGFIWTIPKNADTTTKASTCTYDNIIISESLKEEYNNIKGVYNFDKVYNLSLDSTLEVSDHYPVWANFVFD